jgi:hypothetical protein
VALRWALEEYARVGALAGLGVEFGSGRKVGATVMGVTSVDELEQTVREWDDALTGGSERGTRVKAMVQGQMWASLGRWKGYAWASPADGFVNRRGDRMRTVFERDDDVDL